MVKFLLPQERTLRSCMRKLYIAISSAVSEKKTKALSRDTRAEGTAEHEGGQNEAANRAAKVVEAHQVHEDTGSSTKASSAPRARRGAEGEAEAERGGRASAAAVAGHSTRMSSSQSKHVRFSQESESGEGSDASGGEEREAASRSRSSKRRRGPAQGTGRSQERRSASPLSIS